MGREAILKSKCPSPRADRDRFRILPVPHGILPRQGIQHLGRQGNDLPAGEIIGRGRGALGQLAEPDIAEPHGMAMVLKLDRTTIGMGVDRGRLEPVGSTPEFFIILNENSIVDDA